MTPRIAVIGRGLIGSAAARHLALAGQAPALIGPAEPEDKATHSGVFASHYDEGRITRQNATHPFWAEVSRASIRRYADIEAASGIAFFRDVGALMIGPTDSRFMSEARAVAAELAIPHRDLDAAALTQRFPDLAVSPETAALWEESEAGHVSPRRLVAAQTLAARRAGARLIDDTVMALDEDKDGVTVVTGRDRLRFDRVLVAAGGMTDHLLARSPRHRVYGRTVALFEVTAKEAGRLDMLPSMVFANGTYLLPPIRYPDGRIYLKIGGGEADHLLPGRRDIGDWFRGGGSALVQSELEAKFRNTLPDVQIIATRRDACMTTWTADHLPEIAAFSPRIAVAAAGNGAGAKCSDELGRLGATLVTERQTERITT